MARKKDNIESAKARSSVGQFWSALRTDWLSVVIALLLMVYIFVRPWRDGITFPGLNSYFTALALFTAGLGVLRWFREGDLPRPWIVSVLLVLYVFVACLVSVDTVTPEETRRVALNWFGYVALFFVASTQLRSKLSLGLVVGALAINAGIVATWAAAHRNVQLPLMRQQISESPQVLQMFFGVAQLTPELQNRLESNRAFGSFLFPNALAGFLVVLIPLLVAMSVLAFLDLRAAWRERAARKSEAGDKEMPYAFLIGGLGTAAGVMVVLYLWNEVAWRTLVQRDEGWVEGVGGRTLLYGGVTLALSTAGLVAWLRYGPRTYLSAASVLLWPFCALASIYALMLTVSRGGLAAMLLACILSAVLFSVSRRFTLSPLFRHALFLMLAGSVLLFPWFAAANSSNLHPGPYMYENASTFFEVQNAADARLGPSPAEQISITGVEYGAGHFTDIGSFNLRLTYWQVAVKMALQNWLTGVGWGAFGAVYPNYQYVGAGDVQQAHNDTLQTFSETGIFGYVTFGTLWLVLLGWGVLAVQRHKDTRARWLTAGLFTGVLAFLLHSTVDFHFANPSVVSTFFIVAGLLVAIGRQPTAGNPAPEPSKQRRSRLVAGAAFAGLALAGVAWSQVFFFDYANAPGKGWDRFWKVGDEFSTNAQYEISSYLLHQMHLELAQQDPQQQAGRPNRNVRVLSHLFDDIRATEAFGVLQTYGPDGTSPPRRVQPGEKMPPNTVLVITNPRAAIPATEKAVAGVLERLEAADEIFPFSADHAWHICRMYQLLINSGQMTGRPAVELQPLTQSALAWARTAVERGPTQAKYRIILGSSLFHAGLYAGNQQVDTYRDGIAAFRAARDLNASNPNMWLQYATQLTRLGQQLIEWAQREGNAPEKQAAAAAIRAEGMQMLQEAEECRITAQVIGIYRTENWGPQSGRKSKKSGA